MESVQMNKFEIVDMPGTHTLAFLVEELESEFGNSEMYYALQKLDYMNKENGGRITKEFSVVPDYDGVQDIVLLTLTKTKAILSTAILTDKGLKPTEDKLPLSYGSLYNDSQIEYKEFTYSPNMKRRFSIIDTSTCEEVKPVIFLDDVTGEVRGKCKLLPLRPYVILEIKAGYNRGAVIATDGRRIEAMSHGQIKMPEKMVERENIDLDDELIV